MLHYKIPGSRIKRCTHIPHCFLSSFVLFVSELDTKFTSFVDKYSISTIGRKHGNPETGIIALQPNFKRYTSFIRNYYLNSTFKIESKQGFNDVQMVNVLSKEVQFGWFAVGCTAVNKGYRPNGYTYSVLQPDVS